MLGPIEVGNADGTTRLRGQQAMLLAHLVAAFPQPVSFGLLEQAFWADQPPAQPEAAIKVAVARLRKTIGADVILHTPAGYVLTSEAQVIDQAVFEVLAETARQASEAHDLDRAIEQVEEALECWRGAAFATVDDQITLAGVIQRLDEERASLEDLLVELQLATGRFDRAAANATRNSDLMPLRERRWEQLMIALHLGGRSAESVRVFQQYRSLLGTELGLEPGTSIVELERALISGAPVEAWLRFGTSSSDSDTDSAERQVPNYLRKRAEPPTSVGAFVGRAEDLAALDAALESAQAITLVGAPGVGKSRLLSTWAQLMDVGVLRWIDMGAESPGNAVAAIADELAVSDLSALRGIRIDTRPDERFYLALDNCEHVAADLAPAIDQLLSAHPNLTVVTSSRASIGHRAERLLRVDPLDPEHAATLLRSRSDLGSALTDEDIAKLVQSTDGVPLAIELAATRLRTRSVDEVAADGFSFRRADGEARFGAGIEDLLTGDQRLFDALSTMSGSFSVEAAAHVSDRGLNETRAGLNRLIEASLVDLDSRRLSSRFRVLEPIRQLAQERVERAGEGLRLRARHLEFFAAWTVETGSGLRDDREEHSAEILRSDASQVRAAWRHACATSDVDRASMLAFSWWWMTLRSLAHRDYARPYEATRLPGFEASHWRTDVFASTAMSEWARGRFQYSVDAGEAALQEATDAGVAVPLDARFGLIASYSMQGKGDDAHDQMVTLVREAQEQEAWYYLSGVQAQIAFSFALAGLGDDAGRQASAALESAERSQNTSTLSFAHHAVALSNYEIDPRRALSSAYESIRLSTRVQNRWISGWTTALIGSLYRRTGRIEEAAIKLHGINEHWQSVGMEQQFVHSILESALLLDMVGDTPGVTLALTIANEGRLHHPMMPTDRVVLAELRESHPTPAPTDDESQLLQKLQTRLIAVAGD